ncbi:hypothetical protein [Planomonospora parontospora]|uniref:hypothetical protein n=1 Tax=Planomonospora parontospora TaxID=58119 RepID=UPI0019523565|nr:hypothetical protein [Planomonospora parontospora]
MELQRSPPAGSVVAGLGGLVRIVERELQKSRFRPRLLDGRPAATGSEHRPLMVTETGATRSPGMIVVRAAAQPPETTQGSHP